MNGAGAAPRVVPFAWPDTAEQLDDFAALFPAARADGEGRAFAHGGARLWLPLMLPAARPGERPADYRARLPAGPVRQCVLLLRAGAAALGYWDGDELVRHKACKRYVVRGHGRAQPAHLRSKGKSRYGARLRLQNWQRLLRDVTTRLCAWWDELGAPELVLYAVPVRSLHDLFAAAPRPPFARDDPRLCRIPRHVHEPDHRELLRVRALCARGRLELPA